MDTTETYIEQCERAEEIQGRDWETGDYFSNGLGTRVHCDYDACEGCIWLPRQDDLQAMLGFCGASDIHGWLKRVTLFQMQTPYQSFEQLWLAFVMQEKYSKVWDGQDWIPIGGA